MAWVLLNSLITHINIELKFGTLLSQCSPTIWSFSLSTLSWLISEILALKLDLTQFMMNIEAAFSVQKSKKISFFVDFYFLHLRTLLLNIINWLAIDYMAVTRRDIAPEKKTQHLWQQTSGDETQKSGLDGNLLWHCPHYIDNHVTITMSL